MKPKIFVSYAHDDTKWLKLLDPHLAGLKRHADVEAFDDRKALGGGDWDARIKAELEQADIFLAVVTASFVGSEYINETELPIAKKRRGENSCLIFPVLFDQCYRKLLGIDEINFLPKDDDGKLKPISQWPDNLQSAALTQVIEHLHQQIEAIADARAAGVITTARTGIDLALYRARAQAKWSAIDLAALARPGATDPERHHPPHRRVRAAAGPSQPPAHAAAARLAERPGHRPGQGGCAAGADDRGVGTAAPEPALELIAAPGQRCLVLLGDPGAGKSALTRFVLLRLLAETPEAGSPLAKLHGHLPLLIELRDFVQREAEHRCTDLLSYLGFLGESLGFGFSTEAVAQHLARDKALLIIDGLDEIFDPVRRKLMADQIIGLAGKFPQLRLLLTARIAGFDDQPFRSADFAVATLVDLSPEQVTAFAQHWFGLVFPGDPAAAERARDDLLHTLQRRPQLRVLAGNPMLLTIMATVARHKPLARSRAALYAQALELLCYGWDYRRGLNLPSDSPLCDLTPDDTPLMLRRIAWRMQESPDGLRANAIAESELCGVLEQFFRDDWRFDVPKAARAARDMEQRLQDRNWVVTLRGPELYGFVHRTFLEYLCAMEVAELFRTQIVDADALVSTYVAPHLQDDAWREVIRLLVGSVPISVAEKIIAAIVPNDVELSHHATLLGLGWQALAEVEPRLLPSLRLACARLTDGTYKWVEAPEPAFDTGEDEIRSRTANMIADAAESIGIVEWPVPCPPAIAWPNILNVMPGSLPWTYAADLANAIAALGKIVWNRYELTFQWLSAFVVADKRDFLRYAAVDAIGKQFYTDSRTGEFLTTRADVDPSDSVRSQVFSTLAQNFRNDERTIELLFVRAIDDRDGVVRGSILHALGQYFRKDPRAVALLFARAVDDPYDYGRGAALRALGQYFRDDARTAGLLHARAVDDPGGPARGAALDALGQYFRDDPRTAELLRARAVDDPVADARGAALAALGRHFRDDPRTAELLRARAVDDPEAGARVTALAALGQHFRDDARTAELLRARAVDDPDASARRAALAALVQHFRDDTRTAELLRARAVDDPEAYARGAALAALRQHFRDDARTAELLRARAVDDPDAYARCDALAALGQHFRDDARTAALLRARAVDDPDADARRAALLALAPSLGVEHAAVLCSRDLDGFDPGLDPREPVTAAMVAKAAATLHLPEVTIRDRYEQLARGAPLTLAWQTRRRGRGR